MVSRADGVIPSELGVSLKTCAGIRPRGKEHVAAKEPYLDEHVRQLRDLVGSNPSPEADSDGLADVDVAHWGA